MKATRADEIKNEIFALLDEYVDLRMKTAAAAANTPTPESLRLARKLSATELASISGVCLATVRRVERGQVRRLQVDTLERLSTHLGVPYETYAAAAASVKKGERE